MGKLWHLQRGWLTRSLQQTRAHTVAAHFLHGWLRHQLGGSGVALKQVSGGLAACVCSMNMHRTRGMRRGASQAV